MRHTMDADPHMVFKYRTLGVVGLVLDALVLLAPRIAPRVDQEHVNVVVPQVTDILRRHELFFKINWWASKPCITLQAAEADALLVAQEGGSRPGPLLTPPAPVADRRERRAVRLLVIAGSVRAVGLAFIRRG